MIDISLTDDWSKEESLLVKNILIGALDNLENQDNEEISVLLTNDYEIRKLNKKYRNVNKTTNVLSFPMNNKINNLGNKMLGDIVISKDTLLKESKEKKKDLGRSDQPSLISHAQKIFDVVTQRYSFRSYSKLQCI